MDTDRESHENKLPSLKRASVSSLSLSSLAIQEDANAKVNLRYAKHNSESLPSLASITDDESSRTDSPAPSLRRSSSSIGGWGTAETRRAYTDLTALASASPLLPSPHNTNTTASLNHHMISAPFLPQPATDAPAADLSWGQFLQDEFDNDQDSMSF